MRADGSQIRFRSQSEAARHFGLYSSNIAECCSGKIKSAAGYAWRKDLDAVRQTAGVA